MSRGPWRSRLAAAADVLLDRDAPPYGWAAAARDLHALLSEITGLRDGEPGAGHGQGGRDQATRLPSGLALSPRAAARALDDFVRTARFAQGLRAAVEEAGARFAPPVEVLYAGCGPFAVLCLPLLVRSPSVRVTLLDVHASSLESAAAVVSACGLEPAVVAYECADATRYRHPRALHVVLTETMGQALEHEPQVAVAANLAPQLARGGLLVPERVRVEACLADPAREFAIDTAVTERPRIELGPLLDLDADTAHAMAASGTTAVLTVPRLQAGDPALLMLRTTVTVHDAITLREYESGITYPKFVHALGRLCAGQEVEISYRLGADPGFDCRLAAPRPAG